MDDNELERLASNNPAMTVPAAQAYRTISRSKSTTQPQQSGWRPQSRSRQHTLREYRSEQSPDSQQTERDSDTSSVDYDEKHDKGWRRVVRNFSPSWFSVTMGTGIVSLLFIAIPFKADWLYWLAVAFFGLNTILFTLASGISIIRYTLYPEIWMVMIQDPTNSLFVSTMPIGFATLIEAWIFLCCPYWGPWAATFAFALWVVDAVLAITVTLSLNYLLMCQSHSLHSLDRITAVQLLPISASVVAAGTGAEVARILNSSSNHDLQLPTWLVSFVIWGMATPLSMVILVIYYQRLAVHKIPPREVIVSSFLPLGPLGMGGYTIMYLGRVAREVLTSEGAVGGSAKFLAHVPIAGDVIYMFGILVALIMWGFGITWLVFALATIWSCRPFPFNMGWWGFTFPLGVFAVSTMTFGEEFPSLFFRVLGTILAVAVMMLWCVVAAGTARGAWNGQLFYAPCVKDLQRQRKAEAEAEAEAAADLEEGKRV